MSFLDYINSIFTNWNWLYLAEILVIFMLLCLAFTYYKRHNLMWLVYIQAIGLVAVFVMATVNFISSKLFICLLIIGFTLVPVILFANELKRLLHRMSWRKSRLAAILTEHDLGHEDLLQAGEAVSRACLNMSKSETGALIVIYDSEQSSIADSGVAINALVSSQLLETLFFHKSPLHDGAVFMVGNRIIAAGCYLPLSSRTDLPREFGTRHRAALGVSEQYPRATVIVVSEESGVISAVHDGRIQRYLDGENLSKIIKHAMRVTNDEEEERMLWGIVNE